MGGAHVLSPPPAEGEAREIAGGLRPRKTASLDELAGRNRPFIAVAVGSSRP